MTASGNWVFSFSASALFKELIMSEEEGSSLLETTDLGSVRSPWDCSAGFLLCPQGTDEVK